MIKSLTLTSVKDLAILVNQTNPDPLVVTIVSKKILFLLVSFLLPPSALGGILS